MRPEDLFERPPPDPKIAALRHNQRVGARVEACIALLARRFPDSAAIQALQGVAFADVLALWADQLHKSLQAEPAVSLPMPRTFAVKGLFHRAHHQLLCTEASLLAKRAHIQAAFGVDARILLVGDDDQLAPQLVAAGYRNVTVIDIDPDIVREVDRNSRGRARVRVHDITRPPPADLIDAYALIVMDPPYEVDWILTFVEGAVALCSGDARPSLHLYCASTCLGPQGVTALQQRLRGLGWTLQQFEPGVCKYPYAGTTRVLGNVAFVAVALLTGALASGVRPSMLPRHVGSDLWLLEAAAPALTHPEQS